MLLADPIRRRRHKYQCSDCPYSVNNPSDLHYHHLRIHLGFRPFLCQLCGNQLDQRGRLVQHVKVKHMNNLGRPVRRSDGINWGVRCPICPSRVRHVSVLERHIKKMHGERLKCRFCDFVGKTDVMMARHCTEAHSAMKLFQCTQCPMKYGGSNALKMHVRIVHDKSLAPLACGQCGYKTHRPYAMKVHIRNKHEGVRHQCGACEASFGSDSGLRSHKKKVHDEAAKTQCQLCDVNLSLGYNLNSHVRKSHLGWTQKYCGKCNFKSYDKSVVICHWESVHGLIFSNPGEMNTKQEYVANAENPLDNAGTVETDDAMEKVL